MRQKFFAGLGILLLILIALYFVWMVLHAVYSIFAEHRTERQLSALEQEFTTRRRQRAEDSRLRMENDCEHEFDDCFGTFPGDVCSKCGLARTRPPGACDHIWRRVPGPVPGSCCELCGAQFGGLPEEA